MPVYEYECDHCGYCFDEYKNTFVNGDFSKCPMCNKKAEKILSKTSFILKGGGWANDNYTKKKG